MKATVIIPPASETPPQMPIEGAVIAETFDSLGWQVWVLDVAASNYSVEGLRVEVKKEDPDIIVSQCKANQYRFAKQYIESIRKEAPQALLAVSTDLNPALLMKWLPIDFAIRGVPIGQLRTLSNRTETKNFTDISMEPYPLIEGAAPAAKLPEYHPMTSQFEHHVRIRNGIRYADIPTKLFGLPVDAKDVVDTIVKLRMKYGISGFNLLGPMNTSIEWASTLFRGLEEHDLVGAPANISWACEVSDVMSLTTAFIRQLADHGVKHILFEWERDRRDQIEHIIDTAGRSMVQSIIRLPLGGLHTKLDYLEMGKLLNAHENLPFGVKFLDNPDRYDEEEYLLSLSNGLYIPKSQNLYQDMEILAVRDVLINKDLARLEAYAKS